MVDQVSKLCRRWYLGSVLIVVVPAAFDYCCQFDSRLDSTTFRLAREMAFTSGAPMFGNMINLGNAVGR